MKTPIRILIIEDSDDDKELLLLEIRRGGYDPQYVCVDTPEAFNSILSKENWDIILSDYVMPRFSGLAALQIVKEKGLDIPFIIISGTIGEDVAVAAMKAGAQDYLMKGNLARLIPAVERELKEAEFHRQRKLAAEKITQLSRAVEQSNASIIITDLNGNIEYINPKVSKITGYSAEEIIGKNPRIFSSGELSKDAYKTLWDTILSGNEWKGEFHNKKKDGQLYWELALISPIKDDSGEFSHFLAIKEDITDRKKNEQDLIKAKELAEQSNKLKDAFMANISHEIRTPLNGILGMTSIIYEAFSSHITETEEKYFDAINLSSRRITRTINMIMDYSQLLIGNFPLRPKSINLASIIEEQVIKYKIIAAAKSLELFFEIKAGHYDITGDEYCIVYAVSSLIDNALKFTEIGSVQLLLYEDETGNINFEVKDTGIGISREYLDDLFNPYSQEDIGYGRNYEGLGLSLSLVKKFLNLNGADISVVSQRGSGSIFTIHFDNKKQDAGQRANTSHFGNGTFL